MTPLPWRHISAQLGISHLYASPYLKARPGSTHGYDIVDHSALNPELGESGAFERMNTALAAHGIKQILDFVPNHMGVNGSDNPLWLDVLEWGPDATHAGWFDIDWDSDNRYLHNKLLVPALGDQYGAALSAGDLTLRFDSGTGAFAVWAYGQHQLPICPLHYQLVLGTAHAALERLGDDFSALCDWRPQISRRAAELKSDLKRLASERADVREAIDAHIATLNGRPGDLESWRGLDRLIADQHWRVAHFRVASDDINYRRFFNINDLAGIRMELPEVFDHAHRLVMRLLQDGILDGLRIDHIDGLLDPKAYLDRLRAVGGPDFYLIVEKILAHHEGLREDWPIQGTTGYEFTNQLLAILIDSASEAAFDRIYVDFTNETRSFDEIVRDCKLRIMANEMASELNTLARDAGRIARQNPRTQDFTQNILRRAIREIVACFPVYRTYVDDRTRPADADRRNLNWALSHAQRFATEIDPSVFGFLAGLLSGDHVAKPHNGFSRHSVLRFAMKLQQYSGPVMAKGLEDTAFYRYGRFLALNEVGGHPNVFGEPLAAFHKANAHRAQRWPGTMVGTSSHDTKRGEDTRARLAVLSELPDEWEHHVQTWSRVLRARRGDIEGIAPPDRNDEYIFYQTLIGSWPVELLGSDTPDPSGLSAYAARIKGALIKSMREAKVHSTWAAPDTAYEEAMLAFADAALDTEISGAFLTSFLPFAGRLAQLGASNSLVQTVLKLTVPGMPDIYQGCELWDFNLVDPDNRRPVDFAIRQAMLKDIDVTLEHDPGSALPNFLVSWQDARFKMAVMVLLLRMRQAHPDVFAFGTYEPLRVEGENGDEVVAFIRQSASTTALVVAQRFPARRSRRGNAGDAWTRLPQNLHDARWRDALTSREIGVDQGSLRIEHVLHALPAAVLIQQR